jgi:hypothetical protein
MVEKVEPTAATSATTVTNIRNSLSITSEPDNVLVAWRQSAITAGLDRIKQRDILGHELDVNPDEDGADREKSGHAHPHASENPPEEERLSGESKRIGTGNWEDDVPPGDHVAYI